MIGLLIPVVGMAVLIIRPSTLVTSDRTSKTVALATASEAVSSVHRWPKWQLRLSNLQESQELVDKIVSLATIVKVVSPVTKL